MSMRGRRLSEASIVQLARARVGHPIHDQARACFGSSIQGVVTLPGHPGPDMARRKRAIHAAQVFMLTDEHRAKLKREKGEEAWRFEQHVGEAVIIPAGCPHQARSPASAWTTARAPSHACHSLAVQAGLRVSSRCVNPMLQVLGAPGSAGQPASLTPIALDIVAP